MAILTKRYRRQNIMDDDLVSTAGHSSFVSANFTDLVEIDFDDTLAGAEADVDECMNFHGFFPDAGGALVLVDAHGNRHTKGGADPTPTLYVPPEKWAQQNVAVSQVGVDLSALVSTNFDTIKMIRPGSIVGLSTRFTEAITDSSIDSAIVTITINGVAGALSISHNSGTNPLGGEASQSGGVDTFVAGDLLGIEITTLASFAPTTTDIEAWIDLEI